MEIKISSFVVNSILCAYGLQKYTVIDTALECKPHVLNRVGSPRGVGHVPKATSKSCDALPRLDRTLVKNKIELAKRRIPKIDRPNENMQPHALVTES